MVILASNLIVREKPSSNSTIIDNISYGLYEPVFDENDNVITVTSKDKIDWVKIKLPNENHGFVAKKYTSEYLFYTLVVSKVNGKWLITEFYGDTRNW